ncbi:NAD-dependent epimerase/dehydratase [groundwater metagenome]|uniref:NAD-dependent epimerase/dehydratase n=1 Tax=groundwater metagenome TaxID=717931 RepID=A0A098EEB0_9ZZZZ
MSINDVNKKFWKEKKVLLTGGSGFLGKNLLPRLNELIEEIFVPRSSEFDLRKEKHIDALFNKFKPDIVIHLAADVGGIGYLMSNSGKIYFNNIMMNTLLIEKAMRYKVDKFVGINTVNCYPENAEIPTKESYLWGGKPEKNVASYSMAKRMMIFQSEVYSEQYGFNSINLILDNIYGPFDNFDLNTSRVIPALIRKCINAIENDEKEIICWGDGSPKREFLYVEDAAEGILLATEKYNKTDPINLGAGFEISIKDIVKLIINLTGFEGDIIWDTSKPNGQSRRCLDVSRAKKEFGFEAKIPLEEGLKKTITWYKQNNKFKVNNG